MLVAKLLSKIYKKNGIILIDDSGQKYICGNPKKEKPITIKLLKKNFKLEVIFKSRIRISRSLYAQRHYNRECILKRIFLCL